MIFFYVIIFIIVFNGLRYHRNNQDYISVQQTNAVKGIFIWLVFMGHILPYITKIIPFECLLDKAASEVVMLLQQLVVVPFMFYSGYGVMYSIKNKGKNYVSSIPQKRILNIMLNFGIAVLCFVVLNFILSIPMDFKQVLLSFVCWDSVGNSNWYIFTICFCYFTSYISYNLFGYNKRYLIANISILFMYVLILSRFKGSWWYDTCLAYSAGGIYCYYKEYLENIINRKYSLSIFMGGGILLISYIVMLKAPIAKPLFMNVCSIFFSIFIIILTMGFQLKSRILEWSGKNLFPLYIYQRIPMILFSTVCGGYLVSEWKYAYVIICVVVSIILVHIYKYINIKL